MARLLLASNDMLGRVVMHGLDAVVFTIISFAIWGTACTVSVIHGARLTWRRSRDLAGRRFRHHP